MEQLTLFDLLEQPAVAAVPDKQPSDGVRELIHRRRRQLCVHAALYYRLNTSLVPDATYDAWSRELVQLQTDYPDVAAACVRAELFADFDGSTGFHLPVELWALNKAQQLLKHSQRSNSPKQCQELLVERVAR